MKSSSRSDWIKGFLAFQKVQQPDRSIHLFINRNQSNPLIHIIFVLTRQKISFNFRAIALALNNFKPKS